jgi:hypothetical protein
VHPTQRNWRGTVHSSVMPRLSVRAARCRPLCGKRGRPAPHEKLHHLCKVGPTECIGSECGTASGSAPPMRSGKIDRAATGFVWRRVLRFAAVRALEGPERRGTRNASPKNEHQGRL